jgi:hypothetical protein
MGKRIISEEIIAGKSSVVVFCDAKADITDDMTGSDNREILPFSVAVTKNFERAMKGSDGHWNWES